MTNKRYNGKTHHQCYLELLDQGYDDYSALVLTDLTFDSIPEPEQKKETVKLSITQQEILRSAKRQIDEARRYESFEEYFECTLAKRYNAHFNTPEKQKERNLYHWNSIKEIWEKQKEGQAYTHCNSRTLKRLETLGLIEIIKDSGVEKSSGSIDIIRVLNY